jgi:hypothetical protein
VTTRIYSPSIEPLMQSLLSTLADLDFAHDCELAKIANGSGDETLKASLRAKLEARHRERREPYAQQLRELEARVRRAA